MGTLKNRSFSFEISHPQAPPQSQWSDQSKEQRDLQKESIFYCLHCFHFVFVYLLCWSGCTLSWAVCRVHSGYWFRHTGWMAHARLIHRTHSKHIASSFHETSYREACKLHRSVIALRPVCPANFTPAVRKGREIQFNASRNTIWRFTGFLHFKVLILLSTNEGLKKVLNQSRMSSQSWH